MKTPKLIMALIAILLFTNLLFAGNPVKYNADYLANLMVEKLSRDIMLTDSQKTAILAKAKEYAEKRQNSDSQKNSVDEDETKKQASQQYKAALESILTSEQKAQLTTKQSERRDSISNKYRTNK